MLLMTNTLIPPVPDFVNRGMPPRLTRKEASEWLKMRHGLRVAAATLAKYAVNGDGPPFYRVGRAVLYDIDALDDWAAGRLGSPRSDTSAS